MTLQINSSIEALMTLALAITSADGNYTPAEFHTQNEKLAQLPLFQQHDDEALTTHWLDATKAYFDTYGDGLDEAGIVAVVTAVKNALTPDLYAQALDVATAVANADGSDGAEEHLLAHLRTELEN